MPDTAPPTGTDPEEVFRRPFGAWMQEQREGLLHAELTDALYDVVDAVSTFARAGEVRLVITVAPGPRGNPDIVMLTDVVKTKIPEPTRDSSVWFIDDSRNLTRQNPMQPRLPLQAVEGTGGSTQANTDEGTGA